MSSAVWTLVSADFVCLSGFLYFFLLFFSVIFVLINLLTD